MRDVGMRAAADVRGTGSTMTIPAGAWLSQVGLAERVAYRFMSISTDDLASPHSYDRDVKGVDAKTNRTCGQDEGALTAHAAPNTHASDVV